MKYDTDIVLKWFAEHKIFAMAEYKFASDRKWRFDFVFPPHKIALEVQGGLFTNGRHSRGAALLKEHEKLNAAACRGWRILYVIPDNLCMTETIEMVRSAISAKPIERAGSIFG